MIKGKNCRAPSNLSNISKDTKEACKEKSMNILKSYCQGFNMLNKVKSNQKVNSNDNGFDKNPLYFI